MELTKINIHNLQIGKLISEKWQLLGNSYIDITYLIKERIIGTKFSTSKDVSSLSYENHLTNTTSSKNCSNNFSNNIDKSENENKNILVSKNNTNSNINYQIYFHNEIENNKKNNNIIYKKRESFKKKYNNSVSKSIIKNKNFTSKNNNTHGYKTYNIVEPCSLNHISDYKTINNITNTYSNTNINITSSLINEKPLKQNKVSFTPKKQIFIDDFHGYESDFESVTLRRINEENDYQENTSKNLELNNISPPKRNLKKQKSVKENKHKKLSEILSEENKKEKIDILEYKNITKDTIIDEINDIEKFCIGIFVVGISPLHQNSDTSIFISKENNYVAPCGHRTCSLLFSILPKTINFYVYNNLQKYIDLKDQIAELSFPLGIKLCIEGYFSEVFDPQNSFQKPQKIFYNILQKNDEIYYTATLQYFIKIKILDFKEIYNIDPISIFSDQLHNNIDFKRTMNLLGNLLLANNFIFVPESITLVSKYPFYTPMNMCLNCLIVLNISDTYKLINHIINEVPAPNQNSQIIFYLPNELNPILLNNELNKYIFLTLLDKKNNDNNINLLKNSNLSMSQINSKLLLEILSIDNIIIIFQLILLEQQILFVYNNYQVLSQIIFIFSKLVYPFTYKFTLKPILYSSNFEEYFSKQNTPCIMGIDEYLFDIAFKKKIFNKDIIIFNIKENTFISNKTKKKISKKDLIHEYKLSLIPEKNIESIKTSLKDIQLTIKKLISEEAIIDNNNNNHQAFINIDTEINIVFLKFMISLIGDYNSYTFYIEEETPIFNIDAFIESHKDKEHRNFLSNLIKTKLFTDFLLDCKNLYYSKKKNKLNNNLMEISYFIKNTQKYPELLNNKQLQLLYTYNNNYLYNNLPKLKKENEDKEEIKTISNDHLTYENKNINSKSIGKLLGNKKYEDINKNNEVTEGNNNKIIDIRKRKVSFRSTKNFIEDEVNNVNEKNNERFSDNIKKNLYTTDYLDIPKKNIKKNNHSEQSSTFYNLTTNSNKKNKNQILKKYLLFPYFLKLDEDEENYIHSENYIKKEITLLNAKNCIKIPSYNEPPIFIISKKINYNFDLITKTKTYPLLKSGDKKLISHKTGKVFNHKQILLINKINNENSFSKINYDDFKQINKSINNQDFSFISNCFKLCFSNKSHLSNDQYKCLKKILLNPDNTDFFANLILSDIYFSKYFQKQLTTNGFNLLCKMIKISLKNLTTKENNTGRLLIYACFIYYKIEKEKYIFYIFQELSNGKNNMAKYKILNSEDFWVDYFCFEYGKINSDEKSESDDEDDSSIKYVKNSDLDEKTALTNSAMTVRNIMLYLGFKMDFIENLFSKFILPIYERDQANINGFMSLLCFGKNTGGEK